LNTTFDCVVNRDDQTLVSDPRMLWLWIELVVLNPAHGLFVPTPG
jgi:hypothetical protein